MDEGSKVISLEMRSIWAVRPVLIDLTKGPKPRKMSKVFCEGCCQRTSTKDAAEGLGRSSSAKDSAEALDERLRRRRGNEGSKSVDFVINIDLYCKLGGFTFLDSGNTERNL